MMASVPKADGENDVQQSKKRKSSRKWYNFRMISSTVSILSGSLSIHDMRFKFASRGRQAAPCSLIAIVLGRLFEPKIWRQHHVDQVINNGDKLYRISKTRNRSSSDDYLTPAMVHSKFFIDDYKCSICVESSGIQGDLLGVDMDCPDLDDGLRRFFELNTHGVITAQESSVAIWYDSIHGFFYFDPSSCNEKGMRTKSNGVACFMRFKCTADLQQLFLSNLNKKLDTQYYIDKVFSIHVDFINRAAVVLNHSSAHKIYPKNLGTIEIDGRSFRYAKKAIESSKIPFSREVITKKPLSIIISNYNTLTKFGTVPIVEQNNFNTGYLYRHLEVNIPMTFKELTDDRLILHGWTHDSSEIYKGKGEQSIANCIMAIAMKKVHPVNTWLRPKIDQILALGDALHAEKKSTMAPGKLLNAADFDNTEIMIEGKKYYVDVDLLTIVGTISSKLPSVLNLKQALEEFFLINKDGTIESSSMANAIWTEDDFYYIFDSRECTDVGVRVTGERSKVRGKNEKKDLNGNNEGIDGKSCVMRLSSIDALVVQLLKNLDSTEKNDRFIIRHLTITDDIPGTRPWYDFQPGEHGKTWVLSGSLSNESDEFGDSSRGIQGIAMSVVALINAIEIPPQDWTRELLDGIVRAGDDYYNLCTGQENNEETVLSVRKLKKKLYIRNRRIKIKIQESSLMGDMMATSDAQLPNLSNGLMQFFDKHQFGIVQVKDLSVAIWKYEHEQKDKNNSTKQGTGETSYYYFDSSPRGKIGQRDINEDEAAAACVIRAINPIQLAHCIEMNMTHTPSENNEFFIHSMEIESVSGTMTADDIEKDKQKSEKVALNAYKEMGDDGAYLTGTFNQSSITEFKPRTRNRQQAANALVALAMCQLISPFSWDHEMVDDILKLGDKITEENLINLPEGQDEEAGEMNPGLLRNYLLPSEINESFNIGVNRVLISIDEIIDSRSVESLAENLNEFFANNPMGILRQQDVMLPIWIEDNIYFTMDPCNEFHRRPVGQNGSATVFWFTSLPSLAAHIQQLLINASENIAIDAVQIENEYVTRMAENLRPKRTAFTENLWHNFSKKSDGIWELVGSVPKDGELLEHNINQSAAVAIMSIIFSKVYVPRQWTKESLDEVVITGNKLHEMSIARLGDDMKFLRINQVLTEFFLSNRRLNITVRDCVQSGKIDGEIARIQNLKNGIDHFFYNNTAGVVTLGSNSNIALWKSEVEYYCFFPSIAQYNGPVTSTLPRLVRYSNISLMVNEFQSLLNVNDDYEIHGIDVTDWNKLPPWKFDPSPAIRLSSLPPLNAYKYLRGDARAILRGGISDESDFLSKIMRGHRSAANCVVALGMSVIKNPVTWTRRTLDDILLFGCIVHIESLRERREKQKFKPSDVIRIFRIGANVLIADVDESISGDQISMAPLPSEIKGKKKSRDKKPLRVKGKKKKQRSDSSPPLLPSVSLEEGLKSFFENNNAGILVAGRFMVAIWRDQGIYFIYDPQRRSDQGLADESGVACIMWFACIEPLYELISENIDQIDRYGRYIIYRTIIRTTIIEPLPCPVGFQPFFDVNSPPMSFTWKKKTTTVGLGTLSEYLNVDDDLCVLLGTTHMRHPNFGVTNRGFQSTAIAAVAIVVGVLHVPSTWTAHLLDSLLKYGDILHEDSVKISRSGTRTLSPSELLHTFIIGDCRASIHIDRNTTAGILLENDLMQALILFFRNNCAGILHTQNLAVAVMQHYGKFYMLNPCECDKFGNSCHNGVACIAKCDSIAKLVLMFINYCNYKVPCAYTVNAVNVQNLNFFSDIPIEKPKNMNG